MHRPGSCLCLLLSIQSSGKLKIWIENGLLWALCFADIAEIDIVIDWERIAITSCSEHEWLTPITTSQASTRMTASLKQYGAAQNWIEIGQRAKVGSNRTPHVTSFIPSFSTNFSPSHNNSFTIAHVTTLTFCLTNVRARPCLPTFHRTRTWLTDSQRAPYDDP